MPQRRGWLTGVGCGMHVRLAELCKLASSSDGCARVQLLHVEEGRCIVPPKRCFVSPGRGSGIVAGTANSSGGEAEVEMGMKMKVL